MSLTMDRLTVWLPTRGTVLSDLSTELDGVALMVGRNGAGASTLLRAIGGLLPTGARVSGSVRLGSVPISGSTGDELVGVVDVTHLGGLPDAPVSVLVREADPALVSDLGLDRVLSVGAGGLDARQRAALRVARALGRSSARVVLLDQPFVDLDPDHRPLVRTAIRRIAAEGRTILWAEHLVEEALEGADQVLELVGPTESRTSPADAWNPRTVPAPPAMALARLLGLPRRAWTDPGAQVATALADVVPRQSRRREGGDPMAVAVPAHTRLDRAVELRHGECVGVVPASPAASAAAVDLARRLTAIARDERRLSPSLSVPPTQSVAAVAASWERAHGLPRDSVAARVGPLARLSPARTPAQHSSGEVVALTWALATTRPGPRLLVHPTRGLDPAGRRHVAADLFDSTQTTFLVSDDVEVLVRACRRVLVVGNGTVVADGAPLAVLDSLPQRPQLSRLGVRAVHVADVVPASAPGAVR
jgi:energy-coupling factor transport system ATP-binding protein